MEQLSTIFSTHSSSFTNTLNLILDSVYNLGNDFNSINQLMNYFQHYPNSLNSFNYIYDLCSSLSYSNPKKAYETIRETFPIVNFSNGSLFLNSKGSIQWQSKLNKYNENDILYKSIIFIFCEDIISKILFGMIKNNKITQDLYELSLTHYENLFGLSQFPNISNILNLLQPTFEGIFYFLSISNPIESWNFLLSKLSLNYSNIGQQSFVYGSFLSFSIENLIFDQNLIKNTITLFQIFLNYYNQPHSISIALTNMSILLSNLISSFFKFKKFPGDLLKIIYQSISSNIKNIQSFPILCTFFVYTSEDRMKYTLSQHINTANNLLNQNFESNSIVLFSLYRILSNSNYQEPFKLKITNDNLNWKIDKRDFNQLSNIFQIIKKFNNFSNCQTFLSDFLFQFALNDLSKFIEIYLLDILSDEFFSKNSQSIFLLFNKLFCLIQSDEIDFLKSHLSLFVDNFFSTHLSKMDISNIISFNSKISKSTNLFENSFPLLYISPNLKKMSSDMSKLQKQLSPNNKNPFSYDIKFTLNYFTKLSNYDSNIVNIIYLINILDFKKSFVDFLIPFIFYNNSYISSLVMKTIINLLYYNSSEFIYFLNSIIKYLTFKFEQLYLIINLIHSLIETYLSIESSLSDEIMNIVLIVVFLGLSTPSFEIRSICLDIIEYLPKFSQFLLEKRQIITYKTLENLSNVFGASTEPGFLNSFNLQGFDSFALSNYEFIYYIYFTTLIQEIHKSKFYDFVSQYLKIYVELFEKFFVFYTENSNLHKSYDHFLIGLSTIIVSWWNDDFFDLNKLESIIGYSINIIEVNISVDPWNLILLIYSSSINPNYMFSMLNSIGLTTDYKINSFFYASSHYTEDISIIKNEIQFSKFLNHLNGLIKQWEKNYNIYYTKFEPLSNSKINPIIIEHLSGFLIIIKKICTQYSKIYSENSTGHYLHQPFCSKPFPKVEWFPLIYNLATSSLNQRFDQIAISAFNSYCNVTKIPDELYSEYLPYIMKIVPSHSIACSYILSRSLSFLLPVFIQNSYSEPAFFECISNIFLPMNNISEDLTLLLNSTIKIPISLDIDFDKGIYSNTGHLIALSFLYLMGDIPGYSKSSLKILYHILLTTSIISSNPNEFSSLISFYNDIIIINNNDGSNLHFSQILDLSKNFSNVFKFCSEQFISSSLSIYNIKYYNYFSCSLEHWYKHISFNLNSDDTLSIVPGTSLHFSSYSIYTFLEVFIRTFMNKPLLPPIKTLVHILTNNHDQLELFFVFAINAFQSFAPQSKLLLIYICSIHSNYISKLVHYLQFRYWYYSVIQLKTFDKFFDFEKFLGEIQSKSSSTKINDSNQNVDFDILVPKFILDICLELCDFSNEIKYEILPYILSYCLTRPKNNYKDYSIIFSKFLNTEYPIPDDISLVLDSKQLSIFSSEVLLWATTCGDFEITIPSLQLALSFINNPPEIFISHILKSLKIIISALREHHIPNKNKKKQKDLTRLIQGDEFSIKIYYKYIGLMIELLCKISYNIKFISMELISSLIQFGSCTDIAFTPIFENCIDGLSLILSLDEFNNKFKSNQIPILHGLLPLIAQSSFIIDKKRANFVINNLYFIISKLVSNNLFKLIFHNSITFNDSLDKIDHMLINNEKSASASILYLLPFISSKCSESLFNTLIEPIKNNTSIDISNLWKYFHDKDFYESNELKLIILELLNKSTIQLLPIILKLYSQVLTQSNQYSTYIYHIVNIIYPYSLEIKNHLRIAYFGLKEKNINNSKYLFNFLIEFQKNNIFTNLPKLENNLYLPVLDLPFQIEIKSINSNQLFDNWNNLPPFYPIECSFYYFDILNDLRFGTQTLEIQPFTNYSNLLYKIESIKSFETSIFLDKLNVNNDSFEILLKIINKNINENNFIKNNNNNNLENNNDLFIIPFKDLLPSINEIDLIGDSFF